MSISLSIKGLVFGAVAFAGCNTVDEIIKLHKLNRLDVELAVKTLLDEKHLKEKNDFLEIGEYWENCQ